LSHGWCRIAERIKQMTYDTQLGALGSAAPSDEPPAAHGNETEPQVDVVVATTASGEEIICPTGSLSVLPPGCSDAKVERICSSCPLRAYCRD
jgi:hypothetical protein